MGFDCMSTRATLMSKIILQFLVNTNERGTSKEQEDRPRLPSYSRPDIPSGSGSFSIILFTTYFNFTRTLYLIILNLHRLNRLRLESAKSHIPTPPLLHTRLAVQRQEYRRIRKCTRHVRSDPCHRLKRPL